MLNEKCLHINKNFNKLITFFFIQLFSCLTYSQDPDFSQYFNNAINHNPASAGELEYSRASLIYRNSWPFNSELRNSFISYSASYDQPLVFAGGGIGIIVSRDVQAQGIFSSTTGGVMYSHHIDISEDLLILSALQFSIMQNKLDASEIILPDRVFGNSMDQENISSESHFNLDYSLGFIAIYQYFEGGLSIHHLTRPLLLNDSLYYPYKHKITCTAQHTFLLERIRAGRIPKAIIPSFVYQSQGSFQQLLYGCRYQTDPLSSGFFIKQKLINNVYSLILYLGITYKNYTFGYSYDYNIPKKGISVPFTGSHELTLKLNLHKFEKSKGIKAIKCPKI
ncbi:MAG: PorP/SprF family type IX secretion system membrane protein [Bacteroidales bacterium]|nr:PorP/SprF family type IX secretion system membrane protein [Bacteroidales bacterium]